MQPGIKVKNYMMLSARTGAAPWLLFCKQADYGARRRALRKQSGGLFLARAKMKRITRQHAAKSEAGDLIIIRRAKPHSSE